jgi:hypothetical protein
VQTPEIQDLLGVGDVLTGFPAGTDSRQGPAAGDGVWGLDLVDRLGSVVRIRRLVSR